MAYYGNMDRKRIVFVLDNGIAFLKDEVKEKTKDVDSLWKEFRHLDNLLYNEGRTLLSMTNQVKFEKRLNSVRKLLEKYV